jgi:hypothetical protein
MRLMICAIRLLVNPERSDIDEGYKKGYKKGTFLMHLFETCDFV